MIKLKTLIVDDESLARRLLKANLCALAGIDVVAECENGRQVLEAVAIHNPDLIFLDIQMPGLNGFEVVKRLQADNMPLVVFATAYDQYALSAFELNAVDYILKPFDGARVEEAISRARERLLARRLLDNASADDDSSLVATDKSGALQAIAASGDIAGVLRGDSLGRLPIKDGQQTRLLDFESIDWIDAAGDYMCVHAEGDTHILRSTMKDLIQRLPRNFIRIHRSTIVSMSKIVSVETLPKGESMVTLPDGTSLKVSRNYNDKLKEAIRSSVSSR